MTTENQATHEHRLTAARFVDAVFGGDPFLARTALSAGIISRQDLRTRFRQVHPKVYAWKSSELSTYQKIRAAWLWAGPESVLCGGAAAYLLGEQYFGAEIVDDEVQLWRPGWRTPPDGIVARRWRSAPEHIRRSGMRMTTPARTAIDLARQVTPDVRAIAVMDSMCRTGHADPDAIAETAFAMAGKPGVRRVLELLPQVDPKAESPKETELRLQMKGAGLPRFESQVEVFDEFGTLVSRLDLGNRQWKVGLQYDGDGHLKRDRRDHDSLTMMRLASLGWEVKRVTQGMLRAPRTLRGFVKEAFERQGWEQ
ncbi:hypothetical protein [Dietzia alimentaria]|uniref:hypothetical protein n=1 Tax=Dietzia alimentaria TaxID=665550 RepID=UPI00029AF44D|nr:hypothetical protein [Dietzia alimentaria]